MNVLLLVTLLAAVSFPQGTPEPRPAAPVAAPPPSAAPDTLAGLDALGSPGTLGAPGSTGKDLFSGFS
jgi:hypothetical protein